MANEFVKIDLHIHTPSSHSCYKGTKDDEEYFRILKHAKRKKLQVIAITDHNSILGYKKIIDLKNKLIEEKNILLKDIKSTEIEIKLNMIEQKLSLFEEIIILPGIEFEVNNGIHLLIIFNDTVPIDEIEKVLQDGGYNETSFGTEEPVICSKWSIFELYEESKKHDCIIIDAHTDAKKGIWATIPEGRTRANCFRDPKLYAIGYKNENQREIITQVLKTSREYKRDNQLAFVRFSDAHNYKEVGSLVTWVKLAKIDFASLKAAFANPEELVSTESPSFHKILNSLISKETTFGIEDLSDESIKKFKMLVCAMNNSTEGHLLFGVTSKMGKTGLPLSDGDEEGFHKIVKPILEALTNIEGIPFRTSKLEFNLYSLQKGRIILSMYIPLGHQLATIGEDGCIYVLRKKNIVKLSGPEIQTIIEERTAKTIEQKIGKRMSEIEKSCLLTKNLFESISIVRKFEYKSIAIPFSPKIQESIQLSEREIKKLDDIDIYDNGRSKGNIFFLKERCSPRLKDTYLRYSVPLFNVRNLKEKTEYRETVYIVPGGGVFYSRHNYPFYAEFQSPILKLFIRKDKNSLYGPKFILGYLKSSFLLWYAINKLDRINLYIRSVYENIRIPKLNNKIKEDVENVRKIEEQIDKIIILEKEYLVKSQYIDGKDNYKITEEHNSKINSLAYMIDQIIYQMIGLTNEEVETVEKCLKLNNIFLPESKKLENAGAN